MKDSFSKLDLKTGDFVKNSKGSYGLVLKDTVQGSLIIWFENNIGQAINKYRYFWNVNYDLSFADNTGRITKVYRISDPYNILEFINNKNKKEKYLIWEEKPVKEMTVAEIEEQLGHKVKIVDKNEEMDDDWLF